MVVRGFAPAIFFLILGGLAWGWMAATGKNVVEKMLGKRAWLVYVAVGLAAVLVAWVGRNAYLPFLGPTVFPCAALEDKTPEGADTRIEVQARPGAKIVYWASEPATEDLKTIPTWRVAYAGFKNAGVTTADEGGKAVLAVRKPQSYTVPWKGRIESHVHWRMCLPDGGLGQVETHMVSSEPFQNPPLPLPQPQADQASQPEKKEEDLKTQSQTITSNTNINATTTTTVEGFSAEDKESMFATAAGSASAPMRLGEANIDPRLFQLRQAVEQESTGLFADQMAFEEGPRTQGADLGVAYMSPEAPAPAPSRKRFGFW
jgi:uncharacterized membrane protein YuzA (DUF378 family)